MISNKCISVFKSFSRNEIKLFSHFIESRYFNNREAVTDLYKEIIKYYPAFSAKGFTKEAIYAKAFKRKYNDNTFKVLISLLDKIAIKFLTYRSIEKKDREWTNYMFEEFNRRNLKDVFDMHIGKFEKILKDNEKVESAFFYDRFLLNVNKLNYNIIYQKILNNRKAVLNQAKELSDSAYYLTIFYLTELISEYIKLVVYSVNYEIDFSNDFLGQVLDSINFYKLISAVGKDKPYYFMLDIYLKQLMAYSQLENNASYFTYKEAVISNLDRINNTERSYHFSSLIGLCYIKDNISQTESDSDFALEILNINEIILENEYYLVDKINHIPVTLFRNILFEAIRFKKFAWVEYFIVKYSKKVMPGERANIINFSYAHFYYAQGNMSKALTHLERIFIDRFMYKFDVYNLKIKILFEQGLYVDIIDTIKGYRKFLKRNKVASASLLESYVNFINVIEKVSVYILRPKSGQNFSALRLFVIQVKNINNRPWLKEKIETIIEQREQAKKELRKWMNKKRAPRKSAKKEEVK